MGETFKEIVLNKITDELLSFIFDISREEFEQLCNQKKLQKMLYRSILYFSQSDLFKTEFRGVTFYENKDIILLIDNQKIDASLPQQQISESIKEAVLKCFISEDEQANNKIIHYVVELYLQRAKATIQLYDVIKTQHDNFRSIDGKLTDVQNILFENRKREIALQKEKTSLLKKELYNETHGIICEIMNRYLYFIFKKAPSFSKDEMKQLDKSMANKINALIENIDPYIEFDFCTKPIIISQVNGLSFKTDSVNFFVFSELYFKNLILENTDKILKYKDILDLETYVLILRLRNKLQGVLFPPLIAMGQTNVLKTTNINIDVCLFQKELAEIGKLIISLYDRIV